MPRDKVAALIARGFDGAVSDEEFEEAALEIHRAQFENCETIRRVVGSRATTWRDIPLLPTQLFASYEISTFPAASATRVFHSSGTTGSSQSRHFFRDTSLYRAASIAGAIWAFGNGPFRVETLEPLGPHSSLGAMIDWLAEHWPGGRDAPETSPRLLIAPAFAYVKFIESGEHRELPEGSIVVETGGYKGKSRELSREELHAGIASTFGVDRDRIVGEYGMCELSSPLWQRPNEEGFAWAPWIRVSILDPESMTETDGEGVIAIHDLANLDSSIGILTGDLGTIRNHRLQIIGRIPSAEPKGCSYLIEYTGYFIRDRSRISG